MAWEQSEPSGVAVFDYASNKRVSLGGDEGAMSPEVGNNSLVYYADKTLYYAVPTASAGEFPDVRDDNPYADAINAMAAKGIIQGYEDGYFGVNDLVTRQQYAKMVLLTMAQWKPAAYTATFHDTCNFADADTIERKESDLYAYYYVAKAAKSGLTFGYADGTFRPLNNISRQQVITMIVRAAAPVLEDASGRLARGSQLHRSRARREDPYCRVQRACRRHRRQRHGDSLRLGHESRSHPRRSRADARQPDAAAGRAYELVARPGERFTVELLDAGFAHTVVVGAPANSHVLRRRTAQDVGRSPCRSALRTSVVPYDSTGGGCLPSGSAGGGAEASVGCPTGNRLVSDAAATGLDA